MQADNELELTRFGEYLLSRRMVPQHTASFYVGWVRRFLQVPPDPKLKLDDRIMEFVEKLSASQQVKDWQLEQAERAVKMFFQNYRDGRDKKIQPLARVAVAPDGTVTEAAVLGNMRNVIRTMHYAYRTEQTYMDWASRFFRYLEETDKVPANGRFKITAPRIKDYITKLATHDNVAASTQNQAA